MWGKPAAEKIGIFCPRAMEFITSIVEIPVWIISSGYIREYGLIGEPARDDALVSTQTQFGVHIPTVDVQVILCKHFRALVNGLSGSVEDTTQHVFRYRQLHAASGELDMRGLDVDA